MIRFTKSTPDSRKDKGAQARIFADRRPYDQVLGTPTGASPRGSTYWKRVRRCPREHGLWEAGLRRDAPLNDHLVIGLLVHLGLEHYYRALQRGRPSEVGERDAFQSIDAFRQEPGYEEAYETTERLLSGYFELYRDNDVKDWEVLAVEDTLEAPAELGVEWSGRFDLIIKKRSTGMCYGVEHKTTKMITEDLLGTYQMDIQIPGYCWLFQKAVALDALPPFGGFIVNILTKAKRPEYERVEVCPSRYHLAEFELSMKAWGVMKAAFPALAYPKTFGNCIGAPRYFSRCDYYDLCHGRPELSIADLQKGDPPAGFFRVQDDPTRVVLDPDEAT